MKCYLLHDFSVVIIGEEGGVFGFFGKAVCGGGGRVFHHLSKVIIDESICGTMVGTEGAWEGEIHHGICISGAFSLTAGMGQRPGDTAEANPHITPGHGGGAYICHFVATVHGTLHGPHPQGEGNCAAVRFVCNGNGAVKAYPNGSGDFGGEATEPGIFISVGGAGFTAAGFIKAQVDHIGGGTALFGNLLKNT